jgi:glucose-1-phosphate cytidylyltransferase
MKVILLAGGFGTRLSEYTHSIPKPMVMIGNKPLLIHIIELYVKYNYTDFYIALGYKSEVVKRYFKNFIKLGKKFNFKMENGKKSTITLIDTGKKTLTGGRLKRIKRFLKKDENFMFTYGDGISNINLKKLEIFHNKHKKLVTVTAVHPPARFGEIILKKNKVVSFKEKPQVSKGWINGGFFIANCRFLNFIKGDSTILEKNPLEKVSLMGQLQAFKHKGFWKCVDTKRDKDVLESIYKKNKFKWKTN